MPFSGVFRVRDGVVSLVTAELAGPNGIALSPDERHLYVGNWDPDRKIVMRYTLDGAGSVTGSAVFFDMSDALSVQQPTVEGCPPGQFPADTLAGDPGGGSRG